MLSNFSFQAVQLQEADLFGKVSGINVTQKASRSEVTFDKVPLTLQ